MKLVTWNVNSLKVRLPRVLELLEAHSPDVVMLQETKCAPEAFPELELEAAGYRAVHHSGGRWVGVRVVSVYVPNGREPDTPTYDDKLRFLDAMAGRISELSGEPLVVAGDFNVCPADLDVYDPAALAGATHVTSPERDRFAALLAAGTADAFRELHPDEPGFTWWDYRQGHFHRGMGLRIDAHLVSTPLADRIAACGIDRDFRKGPKPSDHAPLLLELD